MNVSQTALPGVLVIEPRVFGDARGFFQEIFHRTKYAEAGIVADFVQDNLSRSCRGTVRGLHFQLQHAQGKLVHVPRGEIFDVAVDVRRNSPTFGNWVGAILSGENHRQIFIPPGYAHGFLVLSESADLAYKCTDFYHPEHERTLLWNDPAVGIEWPLTLDPILSPKDRAGKPLAELECFEA